MTPTSTLHTSTFTRSLHRAAPGTAQAVFRLLQRLRGGTLEVQLPHSEGLRFGHGDGPHASVSVHDWSVFGRVLASGDIGFGESYVDGHWDSPDLSALLRLLVANRDAVEAMVYGRWWARALYRLRHFMHRNSRAQAQRNIHVHYDLGNAFYRLWLDDTLSYSSAWFDGNVDQPTEDAQWAKVRRALQQCGIAPQERLLEIGCGWGGLAELAAREFGARVTGVTLSREQLHFGQQRLAGLGLQSQAELRLQDWRDIRDGPYDAICSIEMFEAVGCEYWDRFFAVLHRQLKPGGRACIQTITLRDDLFARNLRSSDFIQQYIFPGGQLPSPQALRAAARRAGLEVVAELDFGLDYAETLRRWRERFASAEPQVRQLGFDTRFVRLWTFYLAYCEAAFAERNTSVMQFTLHKG